MQPLESGWGIQVGDNRGEPQTLAHAWYALSVLLLADILSFVDRNVMAVLGWGLSAYREVLDSMETET